MGPILRERNRNYGHADVLIVNGGGTSRRPIDDYAHSRHLIP